jgi:5-methyltetrahydropteroyltriglutamate--homocysteine methyltransferase
MKTACLGYPRIGLHRELKRALEAYWKQKIDAAALEDVARDLRRANWESMKAANLDSLPSNDFSLYDQVLDTSLMVGAVPSRFRGLEEKPGLKTYFAMARGYQAEDMNLPAMEMTKWFNTNYHYIVPEFEEGQTFALLNTKPVDEFLEAKAQGTLTRPVLLGPVSYLLLGKPTSYEGDPLSLLDDLLPVYAEILTRLSEAGAEWVQMDEPFLCLDLSEAAQAAMSRAYEVLAGARRPKLMLTTYFGELRDNLDLAVGLPVEGLHIDLVQGWEQLPAVLAGGLKDKHLSLGVVDGRNIWRTDYSRALAMVEMAAGQIDPEKLLIAPSCSLLFSPYDLDLETDLDPEVRSWMAFARQKLSELDVLKKAALGEDVQDALAENEAIIQQRRNARRTRNPEIRQQIQNLDTSWFKRKSPHPDRKEIQNARLGLPILPTTTIGSFPQTREVRKMRAAHLRGELSDEAYQAFLRKEIAKTVQIQEEIGLDVLVHGEFERTDMVEYFGQKLSGFCFTKHGWVQSYGSRGVRPPVIFGDVARTEPMTTAWSSYAQSLTDKPMKGMLTGPVTILAWSFVRDDQPLAETCLQIALAIREEVVDLESAGISVVQIDEPAFREGLPLRHADWEEYLTWAVDCFRLASSGVRDETQIHTHMCYAEFNDIMQAIVAMDADVISIEASRSRMELLSVFDEIGYPNDIGPGVYDIHSPRVPSQEEMEGLLRLALNHLKADQIWVNPDCGLKTREWDQVIPALKAMVAAAENLRKENLN